MTIFDLALAKLLKNLGTWVRKMAITSLIVVRFSIPNLENVQERYTIHITMCTDTYRRSFVSICIDTRVYRFSPTDNPWLEVHTQIPYAWRSTPRYLMVGGPHPDTLSLEVHSQDTSWLEIHTQTPHDWRSTLRFMVATSMLQIILAWCLNNRLVKLYNLQVIKYVYHWYH